MAEQSSEPMVYRVASINGKSPELFSATIVSETHRQVRIERSSLVGPAGFAFHRKTRFSPAEVARTPEQAWLDYYKYMDTKVDALVQELQDNVMLWAFAADAIAVRLWETLSR